MQSAVQICPADWEEEHKSLSHPQGATHASKKTHSNTLLCSCHRLFFSRTEKSSRLRKRTARHNETRKDTHRHAYSLISTETLGEKAGQTEVASPRHLEKQDLETHTETQAHTYARAMDVQSRRVCILNIYTRRHKHICGRTRPEEP